MLKCYFLAKHFVELTTSDQDVRITCTSAFEMHIECASLIDSFDYGTGFRWYIEYVRCWNKSKMYFYFQNQDETLINFTKFLFNDFLEIYFINSSLFWSVDS